MVDTLQRDLGESLYQGCKNFIRLPAVLRLFNLKARGEWTNRILTELLELLKEMLLEGNMLPNCSYEAKKILCPLSKYMYVMMIAYYIGKSMKTCRSVRDVGSDTISKRKMVLKTMTV